MDIKINLKSGCPLGEAVHPTQESIDEAFNRTVLFTIYSDPKKASTYTYKGVETIFFPTWHGSRPKQLKLPRKKKKAFKKKMGQIRFTLPTQPVFSLPLKVTVNGKSL